MRIASILAGAVLALGLAGTVAPSQAAPFVPNVSKADSAVQQTRMGHGGHHGRHHFRHGGPRFGIYLGPSYRYRTHFNSCRLTRANCADRWGWGTWRFRRCVRNHGC